MPATEGDKRFLYVEASNEALDQQGEVILAKALSESAGYYLKYGNFDLDHITQIGQQKGIPDYHFFEVGRPVEVQVDNRRTFVKGEVFSGEGPAAERANAFWNSMQLKPPQRWYPSVGGAVLEKDTKIAKGGGKCTVIKRVRWTNVGFSKTPVNADVGEVSTIPIGAFNKAWGAEGLNLEKALEAGYGTDSAQLSGGGALRQQSLEGAPLSYWAFRERLAGDLSDKRITNSGASALVDWAVKNYHVARALAAEWVERFLADFSLSLHARSAR